MKPALPTTGLLRRLPAPLAARLGRLGPWLACQDPQALCRRLDLEGWRRVVAAESLAATHLLVEPEGPWQAALWAVAFYCGPVDVALGPDLEPGSLAGLETLGVRPTPTRDLPARDEHPRLALVGRGAPSSVDDGRGVAQIAALASFSKSGRIRVRFSEPPRAESPGTSPA
ncbi:MAG: hypothetical protein AAF725_14315 [Acidobacteriota bacterium]